MRPFFCHGVLWVMVVLLGLRETAAAVAAAVVQGVPIQKLGML